MANGIYSNEELIDTMIVDCNEAVKAVISGQAIQWCKIMYEMVVRLANLKKGIHNDMKNREEYIDLLKQMLKNAGVELQEVDMTHWEGDNDARKQLYTDSDA